MSKNSRNVRKYSRKPQTQKLAKGTNARLAPWLKNALLAGCFLAALGAFAFFTIASASAQSGPPLSAAKQQLQQSQAQWHAVVDKKIGVKGQVSLGSCPVDVRHTPVITTLTAAQMATMHNAYASFASVISAEHKPYFIFGENGKFVVQALALDPCKANLIQQQQRERTFLAPQQGNLVILSVRGDLITYRTSSGASGVFNYVTGQFR